MKRPIAVNEANDRESSSSSIREVSVTWVLLQRITLYLRFGDLLAHNSYVFLISTCAPVAFAVIFFHFCQ